MKKKALAARYQPAVPRKRKPAARASAELVITSNGLTTYREPFKLHPILAALAGYFGVRSVDLNADGQNGLPQVSIKLTEMWKRTAKGGQQ